MAKEGGGGVVVVFVGQLVGQSQALWWRAHAQNPHLSVTDEAREGGEREGGREGGGGKEGGGARIRVADNGQ